jgi:hypothetical protein
MDIKKLVEDLSGAGENPTVSLGLGDESDEMTDEFLKTMEELGSFASGLAKASAEDADLDLVDQLLGESKDDTQK